MTPQQEPAIVSHYNVSPVVDIYGSVQGRDSWRSSSGHCKDHRASLRSICRVAATLVTRGQVATMHSSFAGL